jgi:predicted TPR repeat methyltransferase
VVNEAQAQAQQTEQTGENLELSIVEAMAFATRCHQVGNLDAAEQLYTAVLSGIPDHPDALHYLGVLTHQRGDSERGVELIERAITHAPGNAGMYNNLGNVLYELDRFQDAAVAYGTALELSPEAGTLNNLGSALRMQGRIDEAEAAYRRALTLDAKHLDTHNNLGNLLGIIGRIEEALEHFRAALELLPAHPEARRQLGVALAALGRKAEAAAVYRSWLEDEPNNAVAAHMLAANSGEDVPVRASNGYVELVFDNFASSFDVKLAKLEYRAPELVREALAEVAGTPAGSLVALDAGCGTGLCAPLIEPYVSHLTGVDLSRGMLARARKRRLYGELVHAELGAYLESQSSRFDLIVSADTLIYFGDLVPAIAAAGRALRPGGLLILSVERATDEAAGDLGFVLNSHGRYSHSERHLRRALDAAKLDLVKLGEGVLRREAGKPVAGYVVTARKG